jgi:hypothetical protein
LPRPGRCGFDNEGDLIYIPFSDLKKMTEYFRRKVVNLFLKDDMINKDFARNLLSWKNSGFSIDNSVQILTDKARINLSEYISRAPFSLKKLNTSHSRAESFITPSIINTLERKFIYVIF